MVHRRFYRHCVYLGYRLSNVSRCSVENSGRRQSSASPLDPLECSMTRDRGGAPPAPHTSSNIQLFARARDFPAIGPIRPNSVGASRPLP